VLILCLWDTNKIQNLFATPWSFFFFFFFLLNVIFIELLFIPFNETFFIDSILDDFIFLKVRKL
jgi:hypothetical protein